MSTTPDLEELLTAWRKGDDDARNQLIEILHSELATRAHAFLRREHGAVSIVTGDLVNEAIVKILQSDNNSMLDIAHFMALSATVMRNVLVDKARARNRNKRKGIRVSFNEVEPTYDIPSVDVLDLDHALADLEQIDPRRAKVVSCRFFSGMTYQEIASAMDISKETVKRDWRAAKHWLSNAIEENKRKS